MSFPRITEVIDLIAWFLVQQLHDDQTAEIIGNIKNFRLVCRDFADIGIRYLVPTVIVMRLPESLDIALDIANHPVMRLYVKRLVYYYNTFRLPTLLFKHTPYHGRISEYLHHFWISGEDKRKTERLIQAFPNLNHIEIHTLNYHMAKTDLQKIEGVEFSPCLESSPSLDFLNLAPKIQVLILDRLRWPLTLPVDTTCLKKLSITNTGTPWTPASTNMCDDLPSLEELRYYGAWQRVRGFAKVEEIMALPPTLKVLKLQHVEFTGRSLPANVHTLELCDVVLRLNSLPDELCSISFADLRLFDLSLSKLASIFLDLKPGCEFNVAGCFITTPNNFIPHHNDSIRFIHCESISSGDKIGGILANVLQLPSDKDLKGDLLRRLFSKSNCQERPFRSDIHRDGGVKLDFEIPESFHHDYRKIETQFREQGKIPQVTVTKKSECALCYSGHGFSWSGIVG